MLIKAYVLTLIVMLVQYDMFSFYKYEHKPFYSIF